VIVVDWAAWAMLTYSLARRAGKGVQAVARLSKKGVCWQVDARITRRVRAEVSG